MSDPGPAGERGVSQVSESIANPILNSPYEQPDRYFEVDPRGPTGERGRRTA
ncbi:MAG TPA: hypothetical protein VFD59_06550 [Nocardioidaceae bacterium]|nr:hypothetical protein [Nocardioidaceae bacterium]